MFPFLVQYQWQRFVRFCTSRSAGELITAGLFVALFLGLALGLGWLFVAGFSAVQDDVFLRVALPYFLYELFLLVLCGLVGASALVSGTFSLFRQRGDMWFMASPRHQQLLLSKALAVGVFSLWPLGIVALPMLVAMSMVYEIGFVGFLLGFALVIMLGLFTTMSALAWLLMMGHAAVALAQVGERSKPFHWFLLGIGGTLLSAVVAVWWQLRTLDIFTVFAVRDYTIVEAPVSLIASFFQYYPSHIAATALSALQMNAYTEAGALFLVLCGLTFAAVMLYVLCGRGFLHLWQALQEARFVASAQAADVDTRATSVLYTPRTPFSSLLRKEWVLFWRTPRDVAWLGFLLLLWLVVTSFDIFLVQNTATAPLASVTASEWIQALQFLVIVYFTAALTLRFVFPVMSTERDQFWVLSSAPVERSQVFFAKAVVYIGGVVSLTAAVTVLHVLILPTTLAEAALFLLFAIIASGVIGFLGLAIGARYPNFTTVDPQQLSTSLPGLALMAIAVAYGSGSTYLMFEWFRTDQLWYLGGFLIISCLIVWLVSVKIVRRIASVEYHGVIHS